jgi:hypothetical protein
MEELVKSCDNLFDTLRAAAKDGNALIITSNGGQGVPVPLDLFKEGETTPFKFDLTLSGANFTVITLNTTKNAGKQFPVSTLGVTVNGVSKLCPISFKDALFALAYASETPTFYGTPQKLVNGNFVLNVSWDAAAKNGLAIPTDKMEKILKASTKFAMPKVLDAIKKLPVPKVVEKKEPAMAGGGEDDI